MRVKSSRLRRAATLLELIIVTGLLSIVMVSVGTLIRVSVDYYFYSNDQIEVQRRSLLSLSLLTQELSFSNINTVKEDAGPNPGLIFASAAGPTGGFSRDVSGRLIWNRWISYYVDTVNDRPTLMRKETPIVDGSTHIPDVSPLTVEIFREEPDAGRIMAAGVTNVRAEKLTDAVRVTVTAEVKEGRNWLEMDVDTTIVPKN